MSEKKTDDSQKVLEKIADSSFMKTTRLPARAMGRIFGGPKDQEKKTGRKLFESAASFPVDVVIAAYMGAMAAGVINPKYDQSLDYTAQEGDTFWELSQNDAEVNGKPYELTVDDMQNFHQNRYGRDELWKGDEVGATFELSPLEAGLTNIKALNKIASDYVKDKLYD